MKIRFILALSAVFFITACGAPIGSEKWCEKQKEKPKSDWTMEETGDFTKYCVMQMDPKNWCEDMKRKDKGDWTANEAERYAKQCIGSGD
jgi:hypothetical protein